jgi:signal transduction histidine kinase
VREIVARSTDEIGRSGSEVRLEVPDGITGHWDRLRVDQVIQNLLSNAVKYGQGKPIDLRLTASADRVTIWVKDQGIGIAPEHQARIFQRFERVASDRNYSGFGLGLWIVKQILDAMEGSIQVESTPKEGAAFTVVLPRSGGAG